MVSGPRERMGNGYSICCRREGEIQLTVPRLAWMGAAMSPLPFSRLHRCAWSQPIIGEWVRSIDPITEGTCRASGGA